MNNQITTCYGTATLHDEDISMILLALGEIYCASHSEERALLAAHTYRRIKGTCVTAIYRRERK